MKDELLTLGFLHRQLPPHEVTRRLRNAMVECYTADVNVGTPKTFDRFNSVLYLDGETAMGSQTTIVLYILLLAAVVVVVDLLFFRNHFWERLTVNIGIVLVFAAFYFRFLKRP